MRTNRSLRGGSGKARAIRRFKSARPDRSSFVSTNCMFCDKALLATASTPKASAPKRSGCTRTDAVRGAAARIANARW
jgi:hypothetical protein